MEHTDTVSRMVAEKAQKLLEQDRVRWISGSKFWVGGWTGEYTVFLGNPAEAQGACTCKAARGCSHIIAASAYALANPVKEPARSTDPFEGLS